MFEIKVQENKQDKIFYRMPNTCEELELLAYCGFNSSTMNDKDWLLKNELMIMANCIKHMGPLITKFEIAGDKEVKDYSDLLSVKRVRKLLYNIAQEIIENLGDKEEKKS